MEKIDNSIDIKNIEEEKNEELEYIDCIEEDHDVEWEKLREILEEEKNEELEYIDYIEEGNDVEWIMLGENLEEKTDEELKCTINNEDNSIIQKYDKDILDTYRYLKVIQNEYIKLKNIVDEEKSENLTLMQIYRRVINNKEYKKINIKNKLKSCIRACIKKKSNYLYSFNLEIEVLDLIIMMFEYKNKEDVYDLLKDLITELKNFRNNSEILSTIYIDKIDYLYKVLSDSICLESYINNGFECELIELFDFKLDRDYYKKIRRNKPEHTRKYDSKLRRESKNKKRELIFELKRQGLKNIEISKKIGCSKGYVSDIVNKKK